jgi:two-component system chemotaxis response regulator CheB
MPEMDGLEVLRRVRCQYPRLRSIMFSTLTERGAEVTLDALTLGADDYVTKASNAGSLDRSMARLREELLPKIHQFFLAPGPRPAPPPALATRPLAPTPRLAGLVPAGCARVVALGVSTGGPTALGAMLPRIPAGFPLPVLLVQHMPALFTRLLAERLNAICQVPVQEAVDGLAVAGGRILVAPGDYHLKLAIADDGEVRVRLDQSPPLNSCRPAVDALFASVAEIYGAASVAAVLTGMGQDGLRGARMLKAQGARVLAQDESTSVVWGMPGAVANAGLADAVLPLGELMPEILRLAAAR